MKARTKHIVPNEPVSTSEHESVLCHFPTSCPSNVLILSIFFLPPSHSVFLPFPLTLYFFLFLSFFFPHILFHSIFLFPLSIWCVSIPQTSSSTFTTTLIPSDSYSIDPFAFLFLSPFKSYLPFPSSQRVTNS